ncbi:MAG TPA: hypothetical protein VFR14_08525 [Candidatus Limnocylindrales bacterium]|nr:hypothetical protein [Candidatus Limnocylindrales bacterium]
MSVIARNSGGGIDVELELERTDLLPGRLTAAVLRLASTKPREIRGAFATLVGTEHWQFHRTERDANGATHTRTVTDHAELPRIPVQLLGPTTLAASERTVLPFELPVPPLGPPSVGATVCGVAWELEVKIDVPGFDPGLVVPITVHQPTALLRAGVVSVGQFALWESADAEDDGYRAAIVLDPVPLPIGGPFAARVTLEAPAALDLQEIRAEIRVAAKATVPSGLKEEITVWTARIAGPGSLAAGSTTLEFAGDLPATPLPTASLPHGETDATFRIVLARAWMPDHHLVRDVALATTTEI